MIQRHITRASLLLLVLSPFVIRADHLPDQLHATGKPETQLAGLSITKDGESVSEAIKLYGEPTEKEVAANNPPWTGYRWKLGKTTLEVGTVNGRMTDIHVEGTADGPLSRTGAGLKLGDGVNRLKAIYGPRFQNQDRRVTIQWREPEYTLTAGLDDRGRIISLWLLRPECFPGECD